MITFLLLQDAFDLARRVYRATGSLNTACIVMEQVCRANKYTFDAVDTTAYCLGINN